MPDRAARVVLAPPEAWSEEMILRTARGLSAPRGPLRAGDEVAGLVVVRVDPESGSPADAHTAFEIQAKPRPTRGPLHVAALLDSSASMATPWDQDRSRLDAARDALLAHLRGPGKDHASVVLYTYARDARLAAGPFAPSALAKGSITLPTPAGPARAAAALNAALAHLARDAHDGPQAIVWLTDGPGELAELERAVARAKRLGIAIHVICMAPEMDAALAQAARETGGSAHIAGLPLTFDLHGGIAS